MGGFFLVFLVFFFVSFFTFHLICGVGVGKEGPLDDRLAGNRGWHVHVVGGVHVDGGGHLHDVLLVHRHVVGHLNATLNKDGVLHLVHLNLLLDDGGVVGDGSFEHGGDRDGEMGGGGLEDPGGVAGDEAGLAKVHLLGHHGGGLVDGGHALGLGGGGEGSRGGGRHIVDGVGQPGPGTGAGQDEGECDLGVVGVRFFANFDFQFSGHCAGSNPVVSFTKGFTYKRPHADGDLPLSC